MWFGLDCNLGHQDKTVNDKPIDTPSGRKGKMTFVKAKTQLLAMHELGRSNKKNTASRTAR